MRNLYLSTPLAKALVAADPALGSPANAQQALRAQFPEVRRIASALAWEALEETAKFLSKVDWMFDHSGAMNATQLARRDHYLRTREAVHTALASATPEGA